MEGSSTGLKNPQNGLIETFTHVQSVVDPIALLAGLELGWQAPAAIFSSVNGFGEPAWLEAVPVSVLAIRLAGAPVVCRTKARFGRGSGPRRNVGFQPAGTSNASVCTGPISFAHVYVPDDVIDRIGAELGRPSVSRELRDDLWFVEDGRLEQLSRDYVARSSDCYLPATRLEMEARSVLLLEHLVTRHHAVSERRVEPGGLAAWQERRIVEFLREHLCEDIPISVLAKAAQLSPFHFARQFKRSTGLPPHAYQRRLRCERARELLVSTDLSVGDIAAKVGYETPQAFARMFRAEVGASPTEYRRERRS